MGVWEALEKLNTLVDDSDPDIALPQIVHALQTAEAIRQDGHPRWFILAGLIHDMGKMLCLFGEPQWCVVGDTFPVGCAYSDKIVYHEFFLDNPDALNPMLSTELGIYKPHCGLDNLHLSWGHDEYLYQVVKPYLPNEALWMMRYHSCYVIHRENEYQHLLHESDVEKLKWIRAFNPYDLYSKCEVEPDVEALKPYYQDLIARYFPEKIDW
jgi:inositol oxygenase